MIGHTKVLRLGALALCLSGCGDSKDSKGAVDGPLVESEVAPLIMLVVDTSGSMERVPGCECTTAACSECLPDCSAASPDKNRWTQTLEALTGTYEDFECEALERTDDTAYDFEYPIPYHEPSGTQTDDGVLDEHAETVRFGIATFDPLAPGVRDAQADEGALIVAVDPSTAAEQAEDMQQALLSIRPYGGTPTAAALDELYQLFAEDPALDDERADPSRVRHVVLISEGPPDDCADASGCRTADEAARTLRCGDSEGCDEGVVTKVHVIALSPEDDALDALDAIADAGGTDEAVVVEDSTGIRAALSDVIEAVTEN